MVNKLVKYSILLAFALLTAHAFAQGVSSKEAILKSWNKRIETLIKSSIEARVFLDEDLTEAIKLLETSKIIWADSYSEYPLLMSTQNGGEIILSKHFGLKGSAETKTNFIIKSLFNLKRQMEGSRDFLPEFRIKLFSKKFSSYLFDETDNCTLSVHELNNIHNSIRSSLFTIAVKKLTNAGYSYHSSRPNWVVVINGKETSDTGCRGNNRNIYRLTTELVNTRTGESTALLSTEGTSCGYSQKHYKRSLKQFTKKIKTQIPKCLQTLDL